jgi:DNA-binding NtrC family response regulator
MEQKILLFINDKTQSINIISKIFSQNGYKLFWAESENSGLEQLTQNLFDLILIDLKFSEPNGFHLLEEIKKRIDKTPIVVIEEGGSIPNAVEAMQSGASDYLLTSYPSEVIRQRIEIVLHEAKKRKIKDEIVESHSSIPSIITQDQKMIEILTFCKKISSSNAPVLIQGESGTGKELIARYIHSQSNRRKEPFIAVNCAALPESLFESELFGHEKGAFTGALARKVGKFELANRGTLLLDEISEMSPYLQAKLLRVLQENEIDRIGGKTPIPVDVRVIATTNQDLSLCIEKGTFREDLYFRLNVIRIQLPPLRERVSDIERLVQFFLEKYSEFYGKSFSITKEAIEWLKKQYWKGNVRELKNSIERAVLSSSKTTLDLKDFSTHESIFSGAHGVESFPLCLKEMERKLIIKALEQTGGNRTHAARVLGISIRTLRNKLHEYEEELRSAGLR